MSISSDRTELERQKRSRKIAEHLKEDPVKAKRKANLKAELTVQQHTPKTEPAPTPQTLPTENRPISVPVRDASAPNGLRYRPMKPWERMEGNRVVQFRPMTRREREAEQDAAFFASIQRDDKAFKDKVRKEQQETERWAKEDRQRREHEERTGMRPYEPGRYLDMEDAEKQGYLTGGNA